MTDEARAGIPSRLLLGLLVLGLGVMFALDNLGVLDAGRYWPAALVLLCLYKLSQPRGASGRGLGVVLILVGAWLLVDNLRALTSRVGFWPLVLIVAALALIWEAIRGGRRPWPPLEAGSALEIVAIMGGVERAINSSDFRGGRATADLTEILTLDALHGDEMASALLPDVVDVGDARVAEGGGGAGFAVEVLAVALVGREVRRQDPDRHRPPETHVSRPIHLAHPPRPARAEDLVGAETLAGREVHVDSLERAPFYPGKAGGWGDLVLQALAPFEVRLRHSEPHQEPADERADRVARFATLIRARR